MIFIQRVSTPDKRQYGYKRVPSKDEGPRNYKMLWQNAIKQTVILGKNLYGIMPCVMFHLRSNGERKCPDGPG